MEGHFSLTVLRGVSLILILTNREQDSKKIIGVIGPQRMFGPGAIYNSVLWFWLLGALLPVAFYILMRVFPRSKARLLNAPV